MYQIPRLAGIYITEEIYVKSLPAPTAAVYKCHCLFVFQFSLWQALYSDLCVLSPIVLPAVPSGISASFTLEEGGSESDGSKAMMGSGCT